MSSQLIKNARIQQLAERAGLYVDFKGIPWPKNMGTEESVIAYQKFADLIIRECADAADMAHDARCAFPGDYVAESMGVQSRSDAAQKSVQS